MADLEYTVTNQGISTSKTSRLVSGTIGVYTVKFTFNNVWDGLEKWATFDPIPGTPYKQPLDANGECTIPGEVMGGVYLRIGVFGLAEGQAYPTIWASKLPLEEGCFVNVPPSDWPEPSPLLEDVVKVSEQTFTDAQKAQARTNIGAAGSADMATALAGKVDKPVGATEGNVAVIGSNHNVVDSGVQKHDIVYTSSNLWGKGNVGPFVKTSGVVQLGADLELNTTYTFTADVVSDDTYSFDCRVYLVMKRTGSTSTVYFLINRGERQSATFTTPNDEIINGFVFYASRTASQSTGDTATFSNIQVEKGSDVTKYIPQYTAYDYVARNYPKQIVEKTKWLALGDSITLGVYSDVVNGSVVEQLGKGWVSYLADAFDYDLTILGSRGMGYTASITGIDPDNPDGNRINLNTLLTRAEALTDDYNLITLAFGTNDYSEPSQSTSESIISGLSDAINRLANKFKSARIVVITPFNKCTTNAGTIESKWDCLISREQNQLSLHDVAHTIETTALQFGCDCVNVTDASCLNVYNISKTLSDADRLLPDKTHPSIAGHKLIAKYMANKIMG